MDVTEHSLVREGASITQGGAAATEEVPLVNPDPSTGMPVTPDPVSEGMPWDSPRESTPPVPVTPPDTFRTLPEVQPNATDPWLGDVIEWEGSPEWTTHGPPAVPDFIDTNPAEEVIKGYIKTHLPHQLRGTSQPKG